MDKCVKGRRLAIARQPSVHCLILALPATATAVKSAATTTMESAATRAAAESTANRATEPTTNRTTPISAANCAAAISAGIATAIAYATVSAAIAIASAISVAATVSIMAPTSAEPRSSADEQAADEVVRAIIAIWRARVGIVTVVAIRAGRGRAVVTGIAATHADPNRNLRVSRSRRQTERKSQNAEYRKIT
jgi:hypothetical protein